MIFLKKKTDGAQCRYCKHVTEEDGIYICRKKGQVSSGGGCPKYKFDPFARRERIKRNIDTSAFDPLDFEI